MARFFIVAMVFLNHASIAWTAKGHEPKVQERSAVRMSSMVQRSGGAQQALVPRRRSANLFWEKSPLHIVVLVKFVVAISVTVLAAAFALPARFRDERAKKRQIKAAKLKVGQSATAIVKQE